MQRALPVWFSVFVPGSLAAPDCAAQPLRTLLCRLTLQASGAVVVIFRTKFFAICLPVSAVYGLFLCTSCDSLRPQAEFEILAGFYCGVRNVHTTDRPIRKPSDLSGLKLRIRQTYTMVKMMDQMGVRPVPMSQGEASTALMTDMLGGAENSILTFMLLKHQQAARYYNETCHLIQPDNLLVNKKIFNRLPDKLQRLIRESLPELTKREFELFAGWKCSACIRHRQPEWKRFLP